MFLTPMLPRDIPDHGGGVMVSIWSWGRRKKTGILVMEPSFPKEVHKEFHDCFLVFILPN